MVVLDAMEKCASVRVLQTELNDAPGVCMKLHGRLSDIEAAAQSRRGDRQGHADHGRRARDSGSIGEFARRL